MKIAFVGCGYVFDIYMRTKWAHPELEICGIFDLDAKRAVVVSEYYNVRQYFNYDELLSDDEVCTVVNLTNIGSHFETTRRALRAGKNVYSEKPFTTEVGQTAELFGLANARELVLTGAPCNLYCDSISTMWKAVLDGAVGKPVAIYAELDDNPAHLMHLEDVRSPSGAPFPYVEELQEGCTVEHVGYHLVWACAMFGPVVAMASLSKLLVENKTETPLSPSDTPDLSIACLTFESGMVARITCSWVAPRNHSFRIIGDEGEITADNIFHDQTPVRLERFSSVSLSARKSYSIRNQPALGRMFGVGGRRLNPVRRWKSHAVEAEAPGRKTAKQHLVSWLRRREVYAQDKFLGIAEMALAIREKRPQPMAPDFLAHLNEVTLMIQRAGPGGTSVKPTTTFKLLSPMTDVVANKASYLSAYKPRLLERIMQNIVGALHK